MPLAEAEQVSSGAQGYSFPFVYVPFWNERRPRCSVW